MSTESSGEAQATESTEANAARDAAEAAENISSLADYGKVRHQLIKDSSNAQFDTEMRQTEPEMPPPVVDEKDATTADESESVDASPEESEVSEPSTEKRKKSRPRTTQQRINEVIWQREQARKEVDQLRQQVELLQQPTGQAKPDASAIPAADAPSAPAQGGPSPDPTQDAAPTEEQFSEYGAFVEAKARWAARQELTEALTAAKVEQEQAAQQGFFKERAQRFSETMSENVKDDPEFLSRVNPEILNLRPAMALGEGETPTGATAIADLLVDSNQPHLMMEYLSEHQDDFQRISALHPMLAMRELGRIEMGFDLAPTGPESSPPPSTSRAQPPIKPVSGSARTAKAPRAPEDINSVAEWRVARKKLVQQR